MRILGFDPGLNNTGWSIIQNNDLIDCGLISLNKKLSFKEKLVLLSNYISKINWTIVDEVSIENSYVNINPNTSLLLAVSRGIIIDQCIVNKKDFFFYTPAEVKKNVGATGSGSKYMVRLFVEAIIQNNIKELNLSEHIIDSIAVGLCHRKN